MAKRNRKNNENKINQKIKNGHGQGRLSDYKPWIRIQESASEGLVTRIKGIKTGRLHHTLSTLELDYLYILDWNEKIIDIREQFPLDLTETAALAKEINLPHPPRSEPQNPSVMTTDFLITLRQPIGTIETARTIKYSQDLADPRILEKFEIERLYWEERKIDWGIVTELDINKVLVKNLKWLYKYRLKDSLPSSITPIIKPKLINYLLPIIQSKEISLKAVTKACDDNFRLNPGVSLSLVRYLIATRKWIVNILKPIQPEKVLNFISEQTNKEVLS